MSKKKRIAKKKLNKIKQQPDRQTVATPKVIESPLGCFAFPESNHQSKKSQDISK